MTDTLNGFGLPSYDDAPPKILEVPPQDATAERSVLGAMMLSKDAATEVVAILQPSDFYRPAHDWIFSTIVELLGRGEPADTTTVEAELRRRGDLPRIGGQVYLHELIAFVPSASNAAYYARLVREASVSRQIIDVGTRIREVGRRRGDAQSSITEAQSLVMALETPEAGHGRMIGPIIADVLEEAAAGREALATRSWGYNDDLPPMVCGRTTLIAARPGMGKTTAALDAARHVAVKLGLPVAFFSLEMSQAEVGAKVVAAEAAIPLPHVQKGEMEAGDWAAWMHRNDVVCDAPLYVNDFTATNPAYVRSTCMRLMREVGPLGLVVIDHLGLMEDSGAPLSKSRQQIVSEFSRQLALLAKDLKTAPILVPCQLNRGPEQRTDKVPQVADLRESGSLEQDAYQVLLLHRPDVYQKEHTRAYEADFIIGKNRGGPQGHTVTLTSQMQFSRFKAMAS